jgi:hypothetical protein
MTGDVRVHISPFQKLRNLQPSGHEKWIKRYKEFLSR